MFIAIIIIVISSAPLLFLTDDTSIRWLVYPLSGLQGIGLAIMLNTATSLISDVIGTDTANSAFVYGCYSLFDKFANGFLLQNMIEHFSDDPTALKYILSLVPIACSFMTYVLTYIGNKYFSSKMANISGYEIKVDK